MMERRIDDINALTNALQNMCAELHGLDEELLFDIRLVASELLSNALRYGGGCERFSCVRTAGEVRISVKSKAPFCPPERSVCSPVTAERGRGLYLVDTLSTVRTYSEEEGICVILAIEKK